MNTEQLLNLCTIILCSTEEMLNEYANQCSNYSLLDVCLHVRHGSKWGKRSTRMDLFLLPPSPSLSLPSPSPSLPPLSLYLPTLQPATESGEHCKLPQRGLAHSPSCKHVCDILSPPKTRLVTTKLPLQHRPTGMAVTRKKCWYSFKPAKEVPVHHTIPLQALYTV